MEAVCKLNVRFPESSRSECTYWDQAECPLLAESGRWLTVNMHRIACLGETLNMLNLPHQTWLGSSPVDQLVQGGDPKSLIGGEVARTRL